MKRHAVLAPIMLTGVLVFAGCGQGKTVQGTPAGAQGSGAAAVQSGQSGSPEVSAAASGQATAKAEAQVVDQQVQAQLDGLEKDLQAVGPDTPVDPAQAASGF